MAYNANQRVGEYKKSHRKHSVWKRMVAVLGCAVVFCTTYALILPAITQEHTAHCGIEEHTHSVENGCYEKVLICGYNETGTETGAGTEAVGDTTETTSITEATTALTEAAETLATEVATLPTNTDETDTETTGAATVPAETQETPTDATETVAPSTEGETVPSPETELTHVHTEECYELKLVCQKTEHTHSTACFSDPEADVETAADWEKTFADVELTGEYWNDVLEIAKTQIGYQESEKNYQVVTNDAGEEVLKGYTRYGAWYGMPYEDWCAMFVSFCLHYAQVPTEVFPQSAGCESWIEALEEQGLYYTAAEYQSEEMGGPYEGDLVFFDWANGDGNYDGLANHVGIVSERVFADDGYTMTGFKTIEGNSGNQVEVNEYSFLDENGEVNLSILGYGQLPYDNGGVMATADSTLVPMLYTGSVNNLDEATATDGFAIFSTTKSKAMLSTAATSGGGTTGMTAGDLSVDACIWHFAKVNNTTNTYRIYYVDTNNKNNYLLFQNNGNNLTTTQTRRDSTSFVADPNDDGTITFYYNDSNNLIDCYGTIFAGYGTSSTNKTMKLYYPGIPGTIQTISPSSTTINLFDYRTWAATDDVTWRENGGTDNGINEGRALKFHGNLGTPGTANDYPSEAWVTQGIVNNRLGSDGFPVLSDSMIFIGYDGNAITTRGSLDYLFNTQNLFATVDGVEKQYKRAYSDVKGLLSLSSDGYYSYDSAANYAEFVEDTNRFIVYDNPQIGSGNFFPFDSYEHAVTQSSASTVNLDHYFGMSLTTYFVQNYSGYANADKTVPTTFHFSGDDDVWIFIDGVLVADLGGIHGKATVDINFAEGTVTISDVYQDQTNVTTYFKDIFTEDTGVATATYNGKTTLVNNSSHTLNFFYLERGGGPSNMSLKYNLLEIPATSIYKIDQYGAALAGAEFAVYGATKDETTGNYTYLDSENTLVSLMEKTYWDGIDTKPTGNYWCYGGTDTTDKWDILVYDANGDLAATIPCKYHGVTDGNGEMIFQDDDGSLLSLDNMASRFGSPYFILREVDVPDGYRTVSDESWFHIDPQAGVMLCDSTYTAGVWASNNAWITAENTLDVATEYNLVAQNLGLTPITDTNGNTTYSIPYVTTNNGTTTSSGTLFAVVLKRNGRNFDQGLGYNFWFPVYGSDEKGYQVVETGVPDEPEDLSTVSFTNCHVNVTAAIEAAKKQVEVSGGDDAVIFTPVVSGTTTTYKLLMENLPGKIDRYFTYMLNKALAENENDYDKAVAAVKAADTNSEGTDPQYTIAYYWTNSTLANATAENTVRVYSHDGLTDGNFSVEWGTTIEVPNMENRLFFQKRDQAKSTSMTNGLLNGAVFALYPAIDAAQAAPKQDNHLSYYVGSDSKTAGQGNTVYIIPYTDNPKKVVVFGYTDNVLGLLGYGTYEIETDGIEFNHTNGLVNNSDGTAGIITVTLTELPNGTAPTNETKYYIHPVTNAAGQVMVGVTHSSCDYNNEPGTGHFTKLPEGEYLLREIYPPSGYELNTTDIPVLVNEIGVYANAGNDHDGVSVGNGIGFLSKTLDVFASLNEIDESLAWVYGALLRSDATGFTAFNNVTHDVISVAETEDWMFVKQKTDGSDPRGYGSDKTNNREEAMVSYFEYSGKLSTSDYGSPIYDYVPNDDTATIEGGLNGQDARTGGENFPTSFVKTLAGQGTYRLWTMAGWSDLAIYQDYAYGQSQNPDTTYYEDLTAQGNLSNLFSSSTFVQVTDTPSAVDLVVKKVANGKDEAGNDVLLKGAQFRIRRKEAETTTDADGKTVTRIDTAWYFYDENAESTVWEPDESKATIITTDEKGLAAFYDIAPREDATYYLEEIAAPGGYVVSVEPIEFTVKTVTSGTGDSETHTPTLALSKPVPTVSLSNAVMDSSGTPVYTLTVPNDVDNTVRKAVVNLDITKVILGTTTPLSGAQFQLYRVDDSGTRLFYKQTPVLPEDGTVTSDGIEWVEADGTTLTSVDDGTLDRIFYNLTDVKPEADIGTTYYLVETVAPAGYNLLAQPIRIDVDITDGTWEEPKVSVTISVGEKKIYTSASGEVTDGGNGFSVSPAEPVSTDKVNNVVTTTYGYTITVPNSTGYELPHTGGSGTLSLTLLGLTLAAVGCCGLYGRRKRGGAA